VRSLVVDADVVIENFKPGTLESWGLGWPELSAVKRGLIMLRVSGFGQDGPSRDQPGFGVVAEAMGGLRHLTGEPGRIPVRTGISIGDTIAALHGVIGVLLALYHRKVNGGDGQVVDVALYEAVFNCMESLLPEFSAFGAVREASGSALPGIAPSNAYSCIDGTLLVAGNGDSIFKRLMKSIGRDDLGNREDFANNDGRVRNVAEIDAAIGEWTATRTVAESLAQLSKAHVPVSRIYTAKDISEDPQYRARGMIQRITTRDGYELDVPGIVPKLSLTPGAIRSTAPRLGEDTAAVLTSCGVTPDRQKSLAERKAI
jgi:formyl-CoA transferase